MSGRRILHCIPTMSGGGAERQLAYLAEGLTQIGWEVHVALMRGGPNWERLQSSGAIIHQLDARSAYDRRVFLGLRRIIAEAKPDIIQAWLLQMEVLAGLAALAARTPWVFSERASLAAYPLSAKTLARRTMARFASAIVSNSATGDQYWRNYLGDRSRRHVIRNAVPLEEIDATPSATADQVGMRPTAPLILFAGRLEPQKNADALLRAVKRILTEIEVQCLCCGHGTLRDAMLRWIAAEGLSDRIKIMDYSPHLWGLMKTASVFVSPSRFEGSPNVVLEAMACGVPLVVSDIPEHRELLDERSALMVDSDSDERLADAIRSVLRDPVGAAARVAAARERVRQYGLRAVAQQYSDVYDAILADRRSH